MNIKTTIALTAIFIISFSNSFAQVPSFSTADLKKLEGCWQGTLTYLDYSSGKPYTMPAELVIEQIGKSNQLAVKNIYPNEPKANSRDTMILSAEGRVLDGEAIKKISKLDHGAILIVTEKEGVDGNDNKPATFRHTYNIGRSFYNVKKEVLFTGTTKWIKRHEYSFKRKKCDQFS